MVLGGTWKGRSVMISGRKKEQEMIRKDKEIRERSVCEAKEREEE